MGLCTLSENIDPLLNSSIDENSTGAIILVRYGTAIVEQCTLYQSWVSLHSIVCYYEQISISQEMIQTPTLLLLDANSQMQTDVSQEPTSSTRLFPTRCEFFVSRSVWGRIQRLTWSQCFSFDSAQLRSENNLLASTTAEGTNLYTELDILWDKTGVLPLADNGGFTKVGSLHYIL